ncbi:hypothetical protein D3C81_2162720 [compost metagenome]
MTRESENRDERLRKIEQAAEEARRRKREDRAPLVPDRDLSWVNPPDMKDFEND